MYNILYKCMYNTGERREPKNYYYQVDTAFGTQPLSYPSNLYTGPHLWPVGRTPPPSGSALNIFVLSYNAIFLYDWFGKYTEPQKKRYIVYI